MIISRTPFRISYVGGGSDLPIYYRKSGGAVLSSTINKYLYVNSHDFFDTGKIQTKYSRTETVSSVIEIEHPLLRAILTRLRMSTGLEISSVADVPAGTGMGSSSSFTVGTLHNLMARLGLADEATKAWLAEQACAVELGDLSEPIGKQDQYAAAYGGFNIYRFNPDETVSIEPVVLPDPEGWRAHLRMYYLGNQRSASSILAEQSRETKKRSKMDILDTMVGLVDPFAIALGQSDWLECGRLMHENWKLKQSLASGISDVYIKDIYQRGLIAGALGGKLLGAGGGGFMLFVVRPEDHAKLDISLSHLRPFTFNWDFEGSSIIYSDEAPGSKR
jgi:D-glycero-alpha-D-manno-heptose-7-phosphate kinase